MRDYAEGDFLCEVHWAPCLPFLQLSPVERCPVWTRGRSLGKLRISWWFWLWTKYIQEWQWVKSKRTDQPTVRPVVPLQCALCAYSDGVLVFDYALKSVGHSLVMQVNVSSSLLLPFLLLTTSSMFQSVSFFHPTSIITAVVKTMKIKGIKKNKDFCKERIDSRPEIWMPDKEKIRASTNQRPDI